MKNIPPILQWLQKKKNLLYCWINSTECNRSTKTPVFGIGYYYSYRIIADHCCSLVSVVTVCHWYWWGFNICSIGYRSFFFSFYTLKSSLNECIFLTWFIAINSALINFLLFFFHSLNAINMFIIIVQAVFSCDYFFSAVVFHILQLSSFWNL